MGVGPPAEALAKFLAYFFLVKLFFKEIGAEGAEEKILRSLISPTPTPTGQNP
jgi:hypothetical protein